MLKTTIKQLIKRFFFAYAILLVITLVISLQTTDFSGYINSVALYILVTSLFISTTMKSRAKNLLLTNTPIPRKDYLNATFIIGFMFVLIGFMIFTGIAIIRIQNFNQLTYIPDYDTYKNLGMLEMFSEKIPVNADIVPLLLLSFCHFLCLEFFIIFCAFVFAPFNIISVVVIWFLGLGGLSSLIFAKMTSSIFYSKSFAMTIAYVISVLISLVVFYKLSAAALKNRDFE